jgi:hypothetical protein
MRSKASLQSSQAVDLAVRTGGRPRVLDSPPLRSRLLGALHGRLDKNSSNHVQFEGHVVRDNSPREARRAVRRCSKGHAIATTTVPSLVPASTAS